MQQSACEVAIARIVKAPAIRRDELLDAAAALLVRKGYEQMTVQDVLDHCGIAKGTLYHYFDSKRALLEGVVERLHDAVEAVLAPLLEDPRHDVPTTLARTFASVSDWELSQQPLLVALLPSLTREENVRVLRRARIAFDARLRPRLVTLLERGRRAGLPLVADAENTTDMLMGLWASPITSLPRLLAAGHDRVELARRLREVLQAHERATARLLGAPEGELRLFDAALVDSWIAALPNHSGVV